LKKGGKNSGALTKLTRGPIADSLTREKGSPNIAVSRTNRTKQKKKKLEKKKNRKNPNKTTFVGVEKR